MLKKLYMRNIIIGLVVVLLLISFGKKDVVEHVPKSHIQESPSAKQVIHSKEDSHKIQINHLKDQAQDSKGSSVFDYSQYDTILGNPDAKVRVFEYSSPTCSHCAYYKSNVFKHIKEKYINSGDSR